MSAVIYLAIVVMWAVVLVPMWLRRHDNVAEIRSTERFSGAMHVLSRRPAAGRPMGTADRHYVLMPRREDEIDVHVSGAADSSARATRTAPLPARPVKTPKPAKVVKPVKAPRTARPARARASLAVRRRRWLLGLVAATFLSLVLTVAGLVPWPLQLLVDLVLALDVVHLRTQARQARPAVSAQRRASRPVRAAAAAPRRREPISVAAAARAMAVSTGVAGASRQDTLSAMLAEATPSPYYDEVAPETAGDALAEDDTTWEPVPVPRPTYTMKPAAPRRRAYLPDDFGDVPMVPEPVAPAVPAAPAAATPPVAPEVDVEDNESGDLEEILERRWAVND